MRKLDGPTLGRLLRAALGRRSDWRIPRPSTRRSPIRQSMSGHLAIVLTTGVAWFAFADNGGASAFSFFIGAASILLMAWSFVLAIRLRWLEPFFGGLDSMYKAHRWSGALAVVLMFFHVRIEPEAENGVRGASKSVAEAAEDMAGWSEIMLYVLVGASLLRWVPYRWWRLSHKLLGIPFAFASWHFYTSKKPYGNGSAWGWYFGVFMVAGLVAYLVRIIGRDAVAQGVRYKVTSSETRGATMELRMAPLGQKLVHRVGQFAFIKIQLPGLREPHAFTIASAPDDAELRFFIRNLGDWTQRVQAVDLVGAQVFVEAAYGEFEPFGDGAQPVWWIAGGVGITPFLSAVSCLSASGVEPASGMVPHLVYSVSHIDDATALHELQAAGDAGKIKLSVLASNEGRRFSAERLADLVGAERMGGAHVAVCGPAGLVASARTAAYRLGAGHVETESFDLRSGIGPDLSREFHELGRS